LPAAAALMFCLGASTSCGRPSAPQPPPDPVTLRFGVALPKTPEASAGIRAFVNNLFSESLVGTGWDGHPFARLASEWKWKDDGLTLELRIRDNLKFHDGTPVDNTFVRNTLLQVFKNPNSVSYRSVASVEALENNTVAIRLSRPEALLLSDLSNATISMGDPSKADVGLGAYRLLERGAKTRLAAFDSHYRGKPQIDAIEILEFEDQRTSWAALMRGQIDAVHEILPSALEFLQVEGQSNARTFPFTRPYFIYLLFNVKHPILKSAQVRQALSYAIDRQAIVDRGLDRQGSLADGPIWPAHWAYGTAQKAYTPNVEAATARLDAAGLALRHGRDPGRMPSRFRFKCLTIAKHATFEKIALLLQKQLYEIGIDMEVEAVSLQELGARAASGNFDAILAERTSGRSLVWTYLFFHSKKFGGAYTAADTVLDRLREASTEAAVRTTVSDLQQIFHDDPPGIFIAWPTVARVVSTKFIVPDEEGPRVIAGSDIVAGRDIIGNISKWRAADRP
jgi:ABC-type transport system substrate-binding protein